MNDYCFQDDVTITAVGGYWNLTLGGSVAWEETGSGLMRFVIQSVTSGYVAMAISRDSFMGDDDCYICMVGSATSRGLVWKTAYLPSHQTPVDVETKEKYRYKIRFVNGVMTCSFIRPYDVTKRINGTMTTWDLNNGKFNLLFARGDVTNGSIVYHNGDREQTMTSIQFVKSSDYFVTTTSMTSTTSSGSFNSLKFWILSLAFLLTILI
ncbi:ferric-chelate reductase 1-like [Ciona intestinalis]